jgi:hypothetical protein
MGTSSATTWPKSRLFVEVEPEQRLHRPLQCRAQRFPRPLYPIADPELPLTRQARPSNPSGGMAENSVTHRMVDRVSKPECSLCKHLQRSRSREIQTWYYIFMTALVDSGHIPQKNFPFNNFRSTDLRFTSQAFGR